MKSGKLQALLVIGLCLTEVALFALGSLTFSRSAFSTKSAEMSLFASAMGPSVKECYVNLDIQNGNVRSVSDVIFERTYSENFSKTSTRLLAVSGDEGVASFGISFDNKPLPFQTAAVSGKNYTNNEELIRMETICINLFEYRERKEEHYFDPAESNGFIYIPDYYADYILEHYLPGKGYRDLFARDQSHFISLSVGDGVFYYRIANVFHVRGFQKKYAGERELVYNDYDTGAKLDRFFNGYCFVSNYGSFGRFRSDMRVSLFCELEPKRFELAEIISTGSDYANFYEAKSKACDVFFHDGENLRHYERASQISDAFFAPKDIFEVWHFLLVGLFLCLYIFGLWALTDFVGYRNGDRVLRLLLAETMGYMLIVFTLKRFMPMNLRLQLFFNIPSMILVGAVFIALFVLLFVAKQKRSKK